MRKTKQPSHIFDPQECNRMRLACHSKSFNLGKSVRRLNTFSDTFLEVIKAGGALKLSWTGLALIHQEIAHWGLGVSAGRKANKNKTLAKSLFTNVPNLRTTVRNDNTILDKFVGVHVLSHSCMRICPIKNYFDVRKQLFNVEAVDKKQLVLTIKTNTACLVFYSNQFREFETVMLRNLLKESFSLDDTQLNLFDSTSSSVSQCRQILDNMSSKRKLVFINAETGAITVSRPRFIVLEKEGKKSVSFVVQTESGATLFGVPATFAGQRPEDYIPQYADLYRFGFFKALVNKGYPLKYTVEEMFKILPRQSSYDVLVKGRIQLADFATLLIKLANDNHINFFIQNPDIDAYPLTTGGKICMRGTYIKPGPAGYFVQLERVDNIGEECVHKVVVSYLDSSRHCELQEDNFLRTSTDKRFMLC